MPVLNFDIFSSHLIYNAITVTRILRLIIMSTADKTPGNCSHFPKAVDLSAFQGFSTKQAAWKHKEIYSSAQYFVFSNNLAWFIRE